MKKNRTYNAEISFKAQLQTINGLSVLCLPRDESVKLPSRGLVMVTGSINGVEFISALEPDGRGSHWMELDKDLCREIEADTEQDIEVSIEVVKDWPEPEVPSDVINVLKADPEAEKLWSDVSVKARWDWLRWIRSTKNPETRKGRIEKTVSKLKSGERNPCCFNRSMCTVPEVSKRGVLLAPPDTDI